MLGMLLASPLLLCGGLILIVAILLVVPSVHLIGPTEVGLITKRFSKLRLGEDNPVALAGEAGYQADMLMPGWRWKFWLIYAVEKYPWVQVPAGEIGVVIAQVGQPLPIGAKSAVYKKEFGMFTDLHGFIINGGQKGVQRPVLPPGSLLPIHPVGFLVITKHKVYGLPVSPDLQRKFGFGKPLTCEAFGLTPAQLDLVRIEPQPRQSGGIVDMIGIITTFEGEPLDGGDIASRLGGYEDVTRLEKEGATDQRLIEKLLGIKNQLHNNYQDYQAFLEAGGRIGLQHDPLLYGAYALNPFLMRVELVPMLMVRQGEVAVIKAYTGTVAEDTSGADFKFGALVRPGHRGIWEEPLRTGKYAINPRCYQAEIVPTAILTLNWATAVSQAHQLDDQLEPIVAKSNEGFVFKLDLQVQIHVPDTQAPRVISMVGTMQNLVNEVLQAAVGNHFRNRLQAMPAVKFIETRQSVQIDAFNYIKEQIDQYHVETRGVYIQDVTFPPEMVKVLTEREIANQEVETYKRQKEAQDQRIETEHARGTADMQTDLARSKVGVEIKTNNSVARKAEADGEATYIRETGAAKGAEIEAVGLARARGYEAQVAALGPEVTALVNSVNALAESRVRFTPEILVMDGGSGGGWSGVAGALMGFLKKGGLGASGANGHAEGAAVPAVAGSASIKVELPEAPPNGGRVGSAQPPAEPGERA
jgi:regulator of protease activity HflC (stomatin/prohibitin superfamily)